MLEGVFNELTNDRKISYSMPQNIAHFPVGQRLVEVYLESKNSGLTEFKIIFDAEEVNSIEQQKEGWSAIVQNFKEYVERKSDPQKFALIKDVLINTDLEKVWKVLTNLENYQKWASAFGEGSTFTGQMKYDDIIQFVGPQGDGLQSQVKVFIPNFQVSFQHQDEVKKRQIVKESKMFEGWSGFRETYTITTKNGKTNLNIYSEFPSHYEAMFSEMWDKALGIIIELSEQK